MSPLGAPDSSLVGALVNTLVGCVAAVMLSAVVAYIAMVIDGWRALSHGPAASGRHNHVSGSPGGGKVR